MENEDSALKGTYFLETMLWVQVCLNTKYFSSWSLELEIPLKYSK